jgi:hypothetical protein
MTTALTLITDAMAQANLTEAGQSLPAEEAQTGLRALNRLMGKWSQMRLMIPALAQYSVTLTGASSYTIGPTGAVVGLRPIKVLSVTATDANGTDYEVKVRTQDQWDAIAVKDMTGGPPSEVWYQPLLGNGRLWVYPKSNGYTLNVDAQALVASFPSLSTDLTLPDGYEAAIVPTLADELCSSYGVQTPGDVLRRAAGAVRALKRTNSEPIRADHDLADIGRNTFIIERGY